MKPTDVGDTLDPTPNPTPEPTPEPTLDPTPAPSTKVTEEEPTPEPTAKATEEETVSPTKAVTSPPQSNPFTTLQGYVTLYLKDAADPKPAAETLIQLIRSTLSDLANVAADAVDVWSIQKRSLQTADGMKFGYEITDWNAARPKTLVEFDSSFEEAIGGDYYVEFGAIEECMYSDVGADPVCSENVVPVGSVPVQFDLTGITEVTPEVKAAIKKSFAEAAGVGVNDVGEVEIESSSDGVFTVTVDLNSNSVESLNTIADTETFHESLEKRLKAKSVFDESGAAVNVADIGSLQTGQPEDDEEDSSDTGTVVGIVVACLVALALIVAVVVYKKREDKKNSEAVEMQSPYPSSDTSPPAETPAVANKGSASSLTSV